MKEFSLLLKQKREALYDKWFRVMMQTGLPREKVVSYFGKKVGKATVNPGALNTEREAVSDLPFAVKAGEVGSSEDDEQAVGSRIQT